VCVCVCVLCKAVVDHSLRLCLSFTRVDATDPRDSGAQLHRFVCRNFRPRHKTRDACAAHAKRGECVSFSVSFYARVCLYIFQYSHVRDSALLAPPLPVPNCSDGHADRCGVRAAVSLGSHLLTCRP
jgi:hypothetical protein